MGCQRSDEEIVEVLDPFLDDVRAGLDLQIRARPPLPDLQEAIDRAHRHHPSDVPESCIAASRDPALLPVDIAPWLPPESVQFAAFLSDVTAHFDSWSPARKHQQVFTSPVVAEPVVQRRWTAARVVLAVLVVSGLVVALVAASS